MSPTRRDILKLSAGTVAAALVGLPATAHAHEGNHIDPVRVSHLTPTSISADLSDGTSVQVLLARAPRKDLARINVYRPGMEVEMVDFDNTAAADSILTYIETHVATILHLARDLVGIDVQAG